MMYEFNSGKTEMIPTIRTIALALTLLALQGCGEHHFRMTGQELAILGNPLAHPVNAPKSHVKFIGISDGNAFFQYCRMGNHGWDGKLHTASAPLSDFTAKQVNRMRSGKDPFAFDLFAED